MQKEKNTTQTNIVPKQKHMHAKTKTHVSIILKHTPGGGLKINNIRAREQEEAVVPREYRVGQ